MQIMILIGKYIGLSFVGDQISQMTYSEGINSTTFSGVLNKDGSTVYVSPGASAQLANVNTDPFGKPYNYTQYTSNSGTIIYSNSTTPANGTVFITKKPDGSYYYSNSEGVPL